MRSRKNRFDVLIIGGGPAGSAAAIKLASAGVSVAVLERSDYSSARIGETLPPDANPVLRALGVWEEFIGGRHLPSPGNISAWGSEKLAEKDFLFSPYGCGWHLNRAMFDSILSAAAEKSGAVVFRGTRAAGISRQDGGSWRVFAEHFGDRLLFETRYLLVATGRRAKLNVPLGKKRIFDRLLGAATIYDLNVPISDLDHRTLVEAEENGWWYSAVLPQNQMIAAYMTDTDLLPENIRTSPGILDGLLRNAPHTRDRLRNMVRRETYLIPASTYFHVQFSGPGWLAIGDAAFTLDPLSSMGVTTAIKSGIEAARVVGSYLEGNKVCLREFINETTSFFSRYLIERRAYYDLENRWAGSRFWRRRR